MKSTPIGFGALKLQMVHGEMSPFTIRIGDLLHLLRFRDHLAILVPSFCGDSLYLFLSMAPNIPNGSVESPSG